MVSVGKKRRRGQLEKVVNDFRWDCRAFRTISLEGANSQSSGCSSRCTSRPNSHHEITDDSSSGSSNSEDEDSVSGSPFAVSKSIVEKGERDYEVNFQ